MKYWLHSLIVEKQTLWKTVIGEPNSLEQQLPIFVDKLKQTIQLLAIEMKQVCQKFKSNLKWFAQKRK